MPTMRRRHASRCEVLSVVERGWRGARECSLVLSTVGVPVTHLIKGFLNAELREMIRPYPGIRMISVPRPLFRLWLWWTLCWQTTTGRLRWVLLDHERTLREISWWCRRFGLTSVAVHETHQGYELWVGGRHMPLALAFQRERR